MDELVVRDLHKQNLDKAALRERHALLPGADLPVHTYIHTHIHTHTHTQLHCFYAFQLFDIVKFILSFFLSYLPSLSHGAPLLLLQGFMPLREDFDVEYENDAEALLADMDFTPDDHPGERELKLQVGRLACLQTLALFSSIR